MDDTSEGIGRIEDTRAGWQVAGLSGLGIDADICHRRSHLPGGVAMS
jgi:hypothetical protein